MIRIKHFWIVLFLSAQIATLTGLQFGIFRYRQANIRKDIKRAIKEGVPKDQLVDFIFHTQEESWINLDWTKPEKEFRFNNQMYDIIETRKSNDTIFFKCIHDVKESGLFQQLDLMTNNRSSKEKSIIMYWSKQVYSPMNGFVAPTIPVDQSRKTKHPLFQKSNYHLFMKQPNLPPPKA